MLLILSALIGNSGAPTDPSHAYFVAGVTHYQNDEHQEAHDAFSRCLELNATRTDCMTNVRLPRTRSQILSVPT